MRTGCAVVTLLIAPAACGSSAGAVAARCGPASAKTLLSDGQARVYTSGGSIYGCANRGRGTSYLLGQGPQTRPGQDRVGKLALAGVEVGYGRSRMGVDTVSAEVVVRRLDNGRTVHEVSATTAPVGPEFFQSVDALVVKPDGAVAWIATGGSIIRHNSKTEVDRIDRRGPFGLDSGTAIDKQSLRLRRSELSWRSGGATRSATLL
jgi:hypothetical protein